MEPSAAAQDEEEQDRSERPGTTVSETADAHGESIPASQSGSSCNGSSRTDTEGNRSGAANDGKARRFSGSARERLWTPVFILIIGATLCCYMVGQGANAGTSVYLDRVGESAALAGIGAGAFSIAAALTRLLGGSLADRRGRIIVMLAGIIVMIIGTAGPLLSNTGALFLLWRALQGMGFSAATTASATAAADVLPKSRLGEGIGYYGLGQALAMSVGPALAMALIATDPAENFYLGLTAEGVLALVLCLFIHYERNPSKLPATCEYRMRWETDHTVRPVPLAEIPTKDLPPRKEKPHGIASLLELSALPGTIPMLCLVPTFGFGIYFAGLMGSTLGVGTPGLFYTLSAVSMIVVRLKSDAFMDKVPAFYIMGAAVVSGLVCYGLLAGSIVAAGGAFPGEGAGHLFEWLYYGAGVFYGLCLGVSLPVNQAIAVKLSPPERWGAANALFLFAVDAGIGLSCVVWGALKDAAGFLPVTICVMACIASSLAAAWKCYPDQDKRRLRKAH